jgi:hypothetical protein
MTTARPSRKPTKIDVLMSHAISNESECVAAERVAETQGEEKEHL